MHFKGWGVKVSPRTALLLSKKVIAGEKVEATKMNCNMKTFVCFFFLFGSNLISVKSPLFKAKRRKDFFPKINLKTFPEPKQSTFFCWWGNMFDKAYLQGT
jgi:hypothetical protein